MSLQEELSAAAAQNFGAILDRQADAHPDHVAFLTPVGGSDEPNEWVPLTFAQFRRQAHDVAAGLLSLGLGRQDRAAIMSGTRIEWILADMGISCAGGATTTIYPNSGPQEACYILADSESSVLFVDSSANLAKALGNDDVDEHLRHIVIFDDDRQLNHVDDDRVITMDELVAMGRRVLAQDPDLVRRTIDAIQPSDLATIMYTSGTTGTPKGVEIEHRSWTYMGAAWKHGDFLHLGDTHLLWLPLSHAFGKCLLAICFEIGICQAVEPRIPRLSRSLKEVKPVVLCGVPRIFEKIRSGVMTQFPAGRLKSMISRWAFAVGKETTAYRLGRRRMPPHLAIKHRIADRLVFSRLRVGLGDVKFMISGGAKLSPQVQEWFYSAGIPIVEGYGATEMCAVAFFTPPENVQFGTAGPVCPGNETRIAEDGELLVRGPIVARGYHHLPELTAEAFDNGWFHTGDIGEFDEHDNLYITDRKKDLIKTSGGKYVAPQKVEASLAANIPLLSQAVVLGEGHKYIVALLALEEKAVLRWGRRHGKSRATYADLIDDPELIAAMQAGVDRANTRLERWETVKRFAILDYDMSNNKDLVTTSLKVRRSVVAQQFRDLYESLYETDETTA